MNGQAINVDWVIGLSIFVVTLAGATINVTENTNLATDSGLESKTDSFADELSSDLEEPIEQAPLYVRQPHNVGRIPVDRKYRLEDAGSVYFDVPSRVNVSDDRAVAVVDSGNSTHTMTAFSADVEHSYSSNVTGGDTLSNNLIALDPDAGGIASISFDGEEYLESSTDLGESGGDTTIRGPYGEAFGRLKVYTGSQEFIVENPDTTFEFGNFTELYWEADGSTDTLSGTKEFRDGQTSGIVLAELESSDHAVTLTGELDARVYKDEADSVKVEVDADRARFMLHRGGLSFGKKRVESYADGRIFFGAERRTEAASEPGITGLETEDERIFEDDYGLDGWLYNVSGSLERGSEIPLTRVSVESRTFEQIYWNGSSSWKDLEVAVWQ